MASNRDEHYLSIIGQLMADKDRLLTEKDELIASKDKLWREMYHTSRDAGPQSAHSLPTTSENTSEVQDRTTEDALRAEIKRLNDRNAQLEMMMKKQMMDAEKSSDVEDDMDEEDDGTQAQVILKREATVSQASWDSGYSEKSRQPTCDMSDRIAVASTPSTVFAFKAVIKSTSITMHIYGHLSELAPGVQRSLQDAMDSMIGRHRLFATNHNGSFSACARQHIIQSDTQWTVEDPRCFACMRCFNKRRACFIGLGNKQWAVLPLPQAMRHSDTVWTEEAYYIFRGNGTSLSFPGIWVSKYGQGRKKKVEAVEEIGDLEGVEEVEKDAVAAASAKREDEAEEL